MSFIALLMLYEDKCRSPKQLTCFDRIDIIIFQSSTSPTIR